MENYRCEGFTDKEKCTIDNKLCSRKGNPEGCVFYSVLLTLDSRKKGTMYKLPKLQEPYNHQIQPQQPQHQLAI